jgi:hypothetical protein
MNWHTAGSDAYYTHINGPMTLQQSESNTDPPVLHPYNIQRPVQSSHKPTGAATITSMAKMLAQQRRRASKLQR